MQVLKVQEVKCCDVSSLTPSCERVIFSSAFMYPKAKAASPIIAFSFWLAQ